MAGSVAILVIVFVVGVPVANTAWIALAGSATGLVLAVWAWLRGKAETERYERELMRRAAEDAVVADRVALTRDLHDVVSHGLGLITVRAAVARRSSGDHQGAFEALEDIESTSRRATADLRRMLTVLGTGSTPLGPSPSIGEVSDLLEDARQVGLEPIYTPGDTSRLSPSSEMMIYRIISEGLSNVVRHVGPTTVDVSWEANRGNVVVLVRDHGPRVGWEPRPGTGRGLSGLQAQVEHLDGVMSYGRWDEGFEIRVDLPNGHDGDLS